MFMSSVIRCITVPVDVQRQTVGLPADSRGVGLQQEAAQELDERLFVGKLVQLADQRHAELVLLAAQRLTCNQTPHQDTRHSD